MDKAIFVLEELGAIQDGHLTALGRYMVRWTSSLLFPDFLTKFSGFTPSRPSSGESESGSSCKPGFDANASQMLILATVFQCLDPILTIAACLSSKPVFLSPMDKRDEATEYDI
jgi:ATP-dependent RNA helicase DHX57